MARPARILRLEEAGFAVSGPQPVPLVAWDAVSRVIAFKRDLYIVDQVCVALEYRAQSLPTVEPALVELDENMEGFQELGGAMETHLPSSTPWAQWYLYVAFPAFAPQLLCIYRRDGAPDAVPEPDSVAAPVPLALPETIPTWRRVARGAGRVLDTVMLPLDLLSHAVQYVVLSPVFLTFWLGRRFARRREGRSRT